LPRRALQDCRGLPRPSAGPRAPRGRVVSGSDGGRPRPHRAGRRPLQRPRRRPRRPPAPSPPAPPSPPPAPRPLHARPRPRPGSPTAFCSRTSHDAFGEALLDGLREAGVDVSAVQRGAEPTTLAVATIDGNGSAAYSFYVQGTADRLFAAPRALPAETRAVS